MNTTSGKEGLEKVRKRHTRNTRCNLSPRFFVLMLHYCANLKAIRYESTTLNRIVADKSHRVIVASVSLPSPISLWRYGAVKSLKKC